MTAFLFIFNIFTHYQPRLCNQSKYSTLIFSVMVQNLHYLEGSVSKYCSEAVLCNQYNGTMSSSYYSSRQFIVLGLINYSQWYMSFLTEAVDAMGIPGGSIDYIRLHILKECTWDRSLSSILPITEFSQEYETPVHCISTRIVRVRRGGATIYN